MLTSMNLYSKEGEAIEEQKFGENCLIQHDSTYKSHPYRRIDSLAFFHSFSPLPAFSLKKQIKICI